jgi:hypothetical protein
MEHPVPGEERSIRMLQRCLIAVDTTFWFPFTKLLHIGGLIQEGFHLLRQSEASICETIDELKALGVAQVAPSHCTGDRATALLRDAWGEGFLEGGCGAIIEIPPLSAH